MRLDFLSFMLDKARDIWLTARGAAYARTTGRAAERWGPDARLGYQNTRVQALIAFAARNVPYYSRLFADIGLDVGSFASVEDLKRLPVLEKKVVLEQQDQFCSYESLRRSIRLRTSGTSGHPMQCYASTSQWVVEQGAIWRQWGWAGYRFRDRIAIIRSYRPKPGEPPVRVDRLRNWVYLSPYHLDRKTVREFLHFLHKWRPLFLRGYPSSLALVAQFAEEERISLPSLRGAFAASETLTPLHRAAVRDAFGIEIFDHYGQAEISCMLHECEHHDGMHILDDYAVVELQPTADPARFRLIATNLHNTAMPLLRYDTGDVVRGALRQCKCGRSFPVVDAIEGRSDDNLTHAKGYALPSVNFYTFMSKLDGIRRFQVVQEADGRIRVNLELKPAAGGAAGTVEGYFREATGQPVEIDTGATFVQTGEGKCPAILKRRT